MSHIITEEFIKQHLRSNLKCPVQHIATYLKKNAKLNKKQLADVDFVIADTPTSNDRFYLDYGGKAEKVLHIWKKYSRGTLLSEIFNKKHFTYSVLGCRAGSSTPPMHPHSISVISTLKLRNTRFNFGIVYIDILIHDDEYITRVYTRGGKRNSVRNVHFTSGATLKEAASKGFEKIIENSIEGAFNLELKV